MVLFLAKQRRGSPCEEGRVTSDKAANGEWQRVVTSIAGMPCQSARNTAKLQGAMTGEGWAWRSAVDHSQGALYDSTQGKNN